MKRVLITSLAVVFAVGGLAGVNVAEANDVLPGHDLFTTTAGTIHEFGVNPIDCPPTIPDCSPPIPADFFGPGVGPV